MAQGSPGRDEVLDIRYHVENLARSAQALSTLLAEDEGMREILYGYAKYLLGNKPHSYQALAEYLEMYGMKYLLPDIEQVLRGTSWKTIIELGPGTGWLLRRLGTFLEFEGKRYAFDKREALFLQRDFPCKFQVQDLEVDPRIWVDCESSNTLIVANQFLHCVSNWREVIRVNRAYWLCVEVSSLTWREQMRKYGAEPLTRADLMNAFLAEGYRLIVQRPTSLLHITHWAP